MSDAVEPGKAAEVRTDAGEIGLFDLSDAESGNQAMKQPQRSIATLRLLVRERIKVYGTPLPDGYPLPQGITLEDLLKSATNT